MRNGSRRSTALFTTKSPHAYVSNILRFFILHSFTLSLQCGSESDGELWRPGGLERFFPVRLILAARAGNLLPLRASEVLPPAARLLAVMAVVARFKAERKIAI